MRRPFVLGLCFLLLSSALLAQIPLPTQVIPIAGKTKGGSGTDWITDLAIANLSSVSGTVGVHYFPSGPANTFNGTFSKTFALQAGHSVFVKDVVGSWFPQFGSSTNGFLMIADVSTAANCAAEDPPTMLLVATSRTYNNADPSKTYGQTVSDAVWRLNFTRQPSVIVGVRHQPGVVPGFRTNVGVVNLSSAAISVRGTAYDDGGRNVGSGVKSVPAGSVLQWSLSEFGVPSLASGRVEFTAESGVTVDPCNQADDPPACLDPCEAGCSGKYGFSSSAAFIAWASKIDNGSGDAEFLLSSVDWMGYNATCEAAGAPPMVKLMQKFGFGPPASLTIRKLPRKK
ncbi:MAG: hypothetical protein WA208_17740 [Thermoanaerobaculia bacterium]